MAESSLILTSLSALAAVIVAAITVASWRQLRPEAEQKRQQQAHLRLLALHLCELLNVQPRPPMRLTRDQFVQRYSGLVSKKVARELDGMLDEASRLGLVFVNDRRGGWHEWSRFQSSFSYVIEYGLLAIDVSLGTKENRNAAETFMVGIMHLIGECRDQLDEECPGVLREQLDRLWAVMVGDYWA